MVSEKARADDSLKPDGDEEKMQPHPGERPEDGNPEPGRCGNSAREPPAR